MKLLIAAKLLVPVKLFVPMVYYVPYITLRCVLETDFHLLETTTSDTMDQLPAELVFRIHNFLDPPASFHLSQASKQIAAHSRDALRRHSRLSPVYRTCADTPDVIQNIWEDPDLAWHVGCLTLRSGGEVVERDESALLDLQDASTQCPVAFCSVTPGCSEIHQRLNSVGMPFLPAHGTFAGHRDALHTLLLHYCSRVEMLKIARAPWHDGDQTRFSAERWRSECEYRGSSLFCSFQALL